MSKVALALLSFTLLGAGQDLSTERKIHGIITAIEPSSLTISGSQSAVTARVDPARTKVTVHGHPGKITDLQLTAHAKGEVCLDDVWIAIDAR